MSDLVGERMHADVGSVFRGGLLTVLGAGWSSSVWSSMGRAPYPAGSSGALFLGGAIETKFDEVGSTVGAT